MPDFILNALLGGIGVAIIAGPLGCFIIWKKMSYFGDSLAHAALLGVALSLFIEIDIMYGALAISLLFALLLSLNKKYSSDAFIGILAHSGIALAIIVLSFLRHIRVDVNSLLFGNILTITNKELILIYIVSCGALFWLLYIWKKLLLSVINEDYALAQKINVDFLTLQFSFIISLITAISIKIVGALLITALLIIPATAARNLSRTTTQMAIIASIIGVLSIISGISASYYIDIPTGPSIVVSALLYFIISGVARSRVSI